MSTPLTDALARIAQLEDRVQQQQRLITGLGVLAGIMGFVAFRSSRQRQRATEIAVERINVVEPDGRLAMVIANTARLPDVIIGGQEIDSGRKGQRGPGMLFFNHKGDEAGGLTYGTREHDSTYEAGAHFSFDQYNNDQVVFLSYRDNGNSRRSGLYVVDRPTKPDTQDLLEMRQAIERASGEEKDELEEQMRELERRGELGAQRVFVGSVDRTAMVRLRDTVGRDRIRISVDSADVARLEFLDHEGRVVHAIPE